MSKVHDNLIVTCFQIYVLLQPKGIFETSIGMPQNLTSLSKIMRAWSMWTKGTEHEKPTDISSDTEVDAKAVISFLGPLRTQRLTV
jgi:hypothetical protein